MTQKANLNNFHSAFMMTADPALREQMLREFIQKPENREGLIYLMDAKSVDLSDIIRIPTGMKWVDRMLDGGLPLGYVTLVQSKTGTGKSTFVSQLIMSACDHPSEIYQDGQYVGTKPHRVFLLSNEVEASLSKFTLIRQLAGAHNVEETSLNGGTIDRVNRDAWKTIERHYHDKILHYEPRYTQDGFSHLDLSMRYAAMQGCDLFILDNVMSLTAALQMSDQFARATEIQLQAQVAIWAQNLARELGVCIVLVSHKRKSAVSNMRDGDMNEDGTGSIALANCAGIIIHLTKPDTEDQQTARFAKALKADVKNGIITQEDAEALEDAYEPDDPAITRYLIVGKNRLTGKTNRDGDKFKIKYDEKSRRMGDDLTFAVKRAAWEQTDSAYNAIPEPKTETVINAMQESLSSLRLNLRRSTDLLHHPRLQADDRETVELYKAALETASTTLERQLRCVQTLIKTDIKTDDKKTDDSNETKGDDHDEKQTAVTDGD